MKPLQRRIFIGRDLGVLSFYYFGYSRIRNLVLRFQQQAVARFVTFHDVPPEYSDCFEANLRFLKLKTNVVSLDDFFSGRLSSEKINVVITFDDGYKSWVSSVLPVLKKLELPATFFVASGLVGLTKEEQPELIRSKPPVKLPLRGVMGGLSEADVRKIAEAGFTVGGHTLNHYNLAELRDSFQLRYEIAEDKMRLERMIGRKIGYFAYPSGVYHNPEICLPEVLKELGYRGAVTTVSGFNTVGSSPYLLHREITGASMSGRVFRARVYGNADAVAFVMRIAGMILPPRWNIAFRSSLRLKANRSL
jgi:peptidoglycan/xylan/chitin deacetylase (PgdA/CDA1 family)